MQEQRVTAHYWRLAEVHSHTMVLDIKGHSEDCEFKSSARDGIFWDRLH